MQTDAAGRSILVDQDGVTIAGAGAWEAATQVGITRAAAIETDGDTLVVVKRTLPEAYRCRCRQAADVRDKLQYKGVAIARPI